MGRLAHDLIFFQELLVDLTDDAELLAEAAESQAFDDLTAQGLTALLSVEA